MSKVSRLLLCLTLCLVAVFSVMALQDGGLFVNASVASRYIVEGDVRVEVMSEDVVRVELRSKAGFEDNATLQITGKKEYKGADYTVKTAGDKKVISVGKYNVYVPLKAKTLMGVYVKDMETRKTVWRYDGSETNSGELPMPASTPEIFAINDCPRIIVPKEGYAPGSDDAYSGYKIDESAKDIYLIMADKDARKLRKEYITLTGRTDMIPLAVFGLWESRYYEYTEESALAVVQQYKDNNFYLDNFVIDTDWRRSPADAGGTGYEINTDLFPDMKGFIEKMHELNLTVMANDHVKMAPGAYHAFSPVDIEYRTNGLLGMLEKGLDAWWYDRNWGHGLVSPTSKINRETIGMYLYTAVTEQYREKVAKELGQKYPDRTFIMANVDNIANGSYQDIQNVMSHRYPIQWTGDILSTGASLYQEIANMVKAGNSGIVYESSDLGGHKGKPDSEQYLRWMQYGALSPIYRTHGSNQISSGRTPWTYGEYETEVVRDYLSMRYHLLPLYYALAHENYMTGMPIMRSMEFDYPQYEESKRTDQYLIGENILVAPISNNAPVAPASAFSDLKISFYNNTDMSGEVVASQQIENVAFDWGNGSPANNVNVDNFSAVVTGKFIPAANKTYAITSDDGCRVYINGERVVDHWVGSDSDQIMINYDWKPGRQYEFKVEYFEGSGGAKLQINELEGNKRTVFIPDGEWIDVWTGKTFVGPQTIVVSHGTATSPIFVKAGSVTALAEDMLNTREKDWSNLALDWYPSKKAETKSVLYEDDTKTEAYQYGEYRETVYGTRYNAGKDVIELYIDAAKGTFSGDRAFDNRNWKVRIHAPNGWGAPTEIMLDGKAVTPTMIERNYLATPFSYNGAAPDDDVYEITFSSPISTAHVVSVKFATEEREERPADPEIGPVIEQEEPAPFSITVKEVNRTHGINFRSPAYSDYAFYDHLDGGWETGKYKEYKKPGVENSGIGELSFTPGDANNKLRPVNDNMPVYVDGIDEPTRRSIYMDLGASYIRQDVKVNGKGTIHVFVGGYQSEVELKVSDDEGNVRSVITGDKRTNHYRVISIKYDVTKETVYHLEYHSANGTNNAVYTGLAIEPDRGATYDLSVSMKEVSDYTDLTSLGNQDWYYYNDGGDNPGFNPARKNIPDDQRLISDISLSEGTNTGKFWDYRSILYFSDGIRQGQPGAADITTWSACLNSGKAMTSIKVNGDTDYIQLYLSAYKSNGMLTIKDGGNIVYQDIVIFADGNSGYGRCVEIAVNTYGEEKTFDIEFGKISGTNVALVAIAVGSNNEKVDNVCSNYVIEEYAGGDELSVEGVKDWFTFGGDVKRLNGDYFGTVSGSDIIGSPVQEFKLINLNGAKVEGIANGKNGIHVDVKVKANEEIKITLYVGAWQSTALLLVTDANGNIIARESFSANNEAQFRKFTMNVSSAIAQTLRVDVLTTARNGNGVTFVTAGSVAPASENAHRYEKDITKEPTCQETGLAQYTCVICGDKYDEVLPVVEHKYEAEVTAPTCTEGGYTKYDCVWCDETYTGDETEETGHNYDEEIFPPTCAERGYTDYYCIDCGDNYKDDYVDVLAHTASKWIVDETSTCAKKGSQHKECTVCKAVIETEELPLAEHTYGEWEVVKPATCAEKGSEKRVCTVCENEETRDIEMIEHVYEETVVAPTCKESGYTLHKCKVCSDEYKDSETAKTEHTWNGGEVTTEPTVDKEGEKTYTCTGCGETKTEKLDKLEKPAETETGCGNCSGKAMGGMEIGVTLTALAAAMFVLRKKRK